MLARLSLVLPPNYLAHNFAVFEGIKTDEEEDSINLDNFKRMVLSLLGYRLLNMDIDEINTILRVAYHGIFNSNDSDVPDTS